MESRRWWRSVIGLGGLALVPGVLHGQEALRGALASDRAVQYRPPARLAPDQGLQLGPVAFEVGISLTTSYNSNIRYGGTTEDIDDVIFQPMLDVEALWPITQNSSLTLGTGIGYAAYVENSEYDYLVINPDSALTYSVTIKDVVLSVYNLFSYSGDVATQPELSGIARYPRLTDTFGLRGTWTIEDIQLSAGSGYSVFKAFDDQYSYLDRGELQFFLRGAYLIGTRTSAGLEGTASLANYWDDLRSDFQSYSFGPFAQWAISEDFSADVRGGYTFYAFDQAGPVPAPDDLSSYYVGLGLTHQITQFINHRLSATRDVRVGANQDGDYIEQFNLDYGISWNILDPVTLSLGTGYSWGNEPDVGTAIGEEFQQFRINFGAAYNITEHFSASADYRYYNRDSDQIGRDYDNHVGSITVRYRF